MKNSEILSKLRKDQITLKVQLDQIKDNDNLVSFIYGELDRITTIICFLEQVMEGLGEEHNDVL